MDESKEVCYSSNDDYSIHNTKEAGYSCKNGGLNKSDEISCTIKDGNAGKIRKQVVQLRV
jgi:hypothetical protein